MTQKRFCETWARMLHRIGAMHAGGSTSFLLRTLWAALVLVVPGGFALFLAFALARAFVNSWHQAHAAGGPAPVRRALENLHWRDVAREVRALAVIQSGSRPADAF